MKIAICDDCQADREYLKSLLEKYESESTQRIEMKEYDSGEVLCQDREMLQQCQIVFLDINMKDMDGLQAARNIKEQCPDIYVVLVTAYMNYALDGYKVKASRFLLKDDLEKTIGECMEDIVREIEQNGYRMQFPFVEGDISLRVGDILYIETCRHKNIFYTNGQTYSIYKKLDEIEQDLRGLGFIRVHQSFLVNMHYVDKINSYILKLTTGKEISVPKSRYPEVKRRFALFKGAE